MYPAYHVSRRTRKALRLNLTPQLRGVSTSLTQACGEIRLVGCEHGGANAVGCPLREGIRVHELAHRRRAEFELPANLNDAHPLLMQSSYGLVALVASGAAGLLSHFLAPCA